MDRTDTRHDQSQPRDSLAIVPATSIGVTSTAEIAAARAYVDASSVASTLHGTRPTDGDLAAGARSAPPTSCPPPTLIRVYLVSLAERGPALPSIICALADIGHAHKRTGHLPPASGRQRLDHRQRAGRHLPGADRPARPQRRCHIVTQLLKFIGGDDLLALRDRALLPRPAV